MGCCGCFVVIRNEADDLRVAEERGDPDDDL